MPVNSRFKYHRLQTENKLLLADISFESQTLKGLAL
jgi:hypothetical protein